MATVDEIERARVAAVRNADTQIVEAIARRNASNSESAREKLNDLIDRLMKMRTNLNTKAVATQDDTQEMREAISALEQRTTEMRRVAEHQKKMAEFLQLVGAFAGAGKKLAEVIKS